VERVRWGRDPFEPLKGHVMWTHWMMEKNLEGR
jgi:hypothetical protein